MGAKLIEFYFDFASPFGYFAANQIDAFEKDYGCSVVWKPFLVGAAFKVTGGKPLTEWPLKAEYSRHDMERMRRYLGLPWQFPANFPVLTVGAARGVYWLEETKGEDTAKRFARDAYAAYFGRGQDISDAAVLGDLAEGVGVDRDAFAAALKEDAIKQRLKDETDGAIERGVFGSPFFFIDGEPFWGQDRLWMMREWIERGGW
jgi:2-hydroxychromene-2-carboxylate isomerase